MESSGCSAAVLRPLAPAVHGAKVAHRGPQRRSCAATCPGHQTSDCMEPNFKLGCAFDSRPPVSHSKICQVRPTGAVKHVEHKLVMPRRGKGKLTASLVRPNGCMQMMVLANELASAALFSGQARCLAMEHCTASTHWHVSAMLDHGANCWESATTSARPAFTVSGTQLVHQAFRQHL